MTGRILGIELRRSPAAFIALLSAVLGAGLVASYPAAFEGRWMQLAVAARLALLLLVPLALAGGAWLGRRDAACRVDELFASTAKPRWQRVIPTAFAFAIASLAAYLVVLLIGMAWVFPTARYFPVAAIAVTAVGALSMIAAGWLGMAAGRAVPRLVTAPALAVLGVAVAGLLPMLTSQSGIAGPTDTGPAALLLTPIHDGNLDDFQTIATRVNVTQALWLTALAITGLLLWGVASRRGVTLAVLPAVLAAVVALSVLPPGGYPAAAAYDSDAVELVCDDDGPQVCMTRVHAYLMPDVVPPARRALALLAAKLPNAPTRASESQQPISWARSSKDPAPHPHQADSLVFDLASIGISDRAEYAQPSFLSFLLRAAWEQDCHADPLAAPQQSEGEYLVREVAVAWLHGQPTTLQNLEDPQERQRAEVDYQTLIGLPQTEQRRRMALVRDAALACRGDALMSTLANGTP